MTNQHRTWSRKPRLIDENRDNSGCRGRRVRQEGLSQAREDEPDKEGMSQTLGMSQPSKIWDLLRRDRA
ncbi:hypothetical protein TNCV_4138611 [Trichonephila clavipes]|nr:hypothetical protein TNCV_4138611 [Trichonephila clavipes]